MRRAPYVLTATAVGVVAVLSFRTQSLTASPTSSSAITSTTAPSTSSSSTSSSSTTGTSTTGTSSTSSASGTATGAAEETRYGLVQVKVTVSEGRIEDVTAVELSATDAHSEQINSEAVPELRQEVLSAQSAQIDGVSGATYTSQGYEASLQSALDQLGFK
jgi:uncharacterized protein with FMN-binding domain